MLASNLNVDNRLLSTAYARNVVALLPIRPTTRVNPKKATINSSDMENDAIIQFYLVTIDYNTYSILTKIRGMALPNSHP